MRSPFPGMDPYLERHWLDVHHSLCVYARGKLNGKLPPGLVARVGVRLVAWDGDPRGDRFRQGYVRVFEKTNGHRLVTLIEFVSPSNKGAGRGRAEYEAQRSDAVAAGANVVEVDLTRDGALALFDQSRGLPGSPYLVSVLRQPKRHIDLFAIPLRERLPAVRIPLREPDDDVLLDLQALVDEAYFGGRYDDLEYDEPCVPPLDEDDAAWARDVVRDGVR